MILFKEEPIDSLLAINTPSYVQQNVYGNLRYYPVVEPVNFISAEDITEEHKKNAMKYNTVEEVVESFFKYNPEKSEGKLTDSVEINFLGFKYMYHPHHKTHYGNVSKSYLLLPIIARWYTAVNSNASDDDFTDAHRFPRGFNGGESAPFKYEIIGSTMKDNQQERGNSSKFIIPMLAKGSPWRNIYLMSNQSEDVYNVLDELLEKHGIDPSTDLNGADDKDVVLSLNKDGKPTFLIFTNLIELTSTSGISYTKVDTSGNVFMFEAKSLNGINPQSDIVTDINKYL